MEAQELPSLAVRYRPQSWDDLVGQGHVKIVMSDIVRRVRLGEITIPPGVLITGPWGCGKTTTARILAAALNCTRPYVSVEEDPDQAFEGDPWPCLNCKSCEAIFNETSSAVEELDGATSGGVDSIRKIAEMARIHHAGRFKVFIIDEVHAMTKDAFSSLLKQLEEPPPDVVYVLVTTDLHSVPVTIQSRCIDFVLTTLGSKLISGRLIDICQSEGFDCSIEVCDYIAERSKGALRDAVMKLDKMSLSKRFDLEWAKELWPDTGVAFATDFLRSAMDGDFSAGMESVANAYATVRDSGVLIDAICVRLRNIAMASLEDDRKKKGGQEASELIKAAWDFRMHVRNANPTDPSPVEALWCVFTSLYNGPVTSFANMRAAAGDGRSGGHTLAMPLRLPDVALAGAVDTGSVSSDDEIDLDNL